MNPPEPIEAANSYAAVEEDAMLPLLAVAQSDDVKQPRHPRQSES